MKFLLMKQQKDHDKDERLDGTNIYTSDKIVVMDVLESGATDGYVSFELNLEYKQEFDRNKTVSFCYYMFVK